jgi:predicted transcriptional regulator
MPVQTIGEQELALLHHVAENGPATVGEVAATFGTRRDLARSTVLTMMERLRKKKQLDRRLVEGVYRYRTRASSEELVRGSIRRFVESHLGGSIVPLVAYLQESASLTEADRREIEALLDGLSAATEKESRR